MLAEPRQTRLDRGRLKLGGDHASWYGGVVNVDYRRQITFDSVADDHFLRDTASHPQGKLDSNAGSPIQGLRFLVGLRLAAGGLGAVSVELADAVAAGLAIGNANVGDGKTDVVGDAVDEEDGVTDGDSTGVGVGLGVGEGRMIFSQ